MLGIVVPAHNEEDHLPVCLRALRKAARHPHLAGEAVQIAVVLDACTDRSAAIAARYRVLCLPIAARNVGRARATGAERLIAAGARWLAFTDADTVVSPSWLCDHLALGADAVCGSVSVADWLDHPAEVQARYCAGYRDMDGHRHIHGANLGVSAAAYVAAGGFPPLALSEDVALVEALHAKGFDVAWSCRPRVATSARRDGRANGGFSDHILSLHRALASPLTVSGVTPAPSAHANANRISPVRPSGPGRRQ